MYWQTNFAMGFGVSEYSFYTYMAKPDFQYKDSAMGEMDGGANEIAFNGQYLLDAIKAGKAYAEEAKLMLNTASSPMAITPMNRNDYYQLVLPVRRL